jgi:serine/threonine-protein kinase
VVQAEIAKEVAEALKVELRATEESRLESRPAVRPDSYLAYMKALTILHTYSRASLQAAKAQFELAISLDPNNAAAYAGLANATRRLGIWFTDDSQRDWLDISERLVRRAIEIDPNLAEAHSSLAFLLFKQYDWSGAEKEYELAQSLDPSAAETHNLYAQALANKARADDAVVQYKLAEAADPLWPTNLLLFARLLAWLGHVDEALVRIQKVGELNPGSQDYHYARFECYLASGDLQEALKELNLSVELEAEPRLKPIHRAMYYALSGESEKSRALLRHEERLPLFGQIPVYVAWIYAELGDLDETFRWLEKAFLSHNLPISEFQLDPRLAHVRADPRFQALLRKMNFA